MLSVILQLSGELCVVVVVVVVLGGLVLTRCGVVGHLGDTVGARVLRGFTVVVVVVVGVVVPGVLLS